MSQDKFTTFWEVQEKFMGKSDPFKKQYEAILDAVEKKPAIDFKSMGQKLSEVKLHDTTDAMVWAQEFCRINPGVELDTMLGWFANAIETGRNAGYRRAERTGDLCAEALAGAEVKKFSPKPGDIFFVTLKSDDIDELTVRRCREAWKKQIPDNRGIFFGMGIDDAVEVELKDQAQLRQEGLCPQCGMQGQYLNLALCCPEHGPYES
jgi:hypothetical protein